MKKLHKKHFDTLAEYIQQEYTRRSKKRGDLEKQWEDIDRQLKMKPDTYHKLDAKGNPDKNKAWMPEMELPLQAQALEILTADARRLRSANTRPWFAAHSVLTDDFLDEIDFTSIAAGDKTGVPTQFDQNDIDQIIAGTMMHWQRQYNFHDNVDMIDAEAFKYGLGVGRGRLVTKSVFMHTAKGVVKQDQKIPVLFPRSIKNTYPDDRSHVLMNEGYMLGGMEITAKSQLLEDVKMAAKKGKKDPADEDGGWMTEPFKNLKGKKDGTIEVIEAEGDFVIPRSSDTITLSNYIITVAVGESNPTIIRARRRNTPYSTLIYFPYHIEHIDSPYATSPLMKGRPIQIAATDSMNRLSMLAAMHSQPPVKYDKDNPDFASTGGPLVYPGAQWPDTNVIMEVIGDPSAMMQLYINYIKQYEDVTGVNSPRLGAQTKSHTTAYAKDAELTRGTMRTVDYSTSCLNGPLAKWLTMAYDMGRREMKNDTVYIDKYRSFVEIGKKHLPEKVIFEAFGAGAPADEQVKQQERMNALKLAMQVDQMEVQLGREPQMDLQAVKEEILRNGGWTDIESFFKAEAISGLPEGGPAMGGTPGFVTQEPGDMPV